MAIPSPACQGEGGEDETYLNTFIKAARYVN